MRGRSSCSWAALAAIVVVAAGPLVLASDAGVPQAQLDHLIYGVPVLEDGARMFEEQHGASAVFGGVHPGRGTANYLLSLGEGAYLEIIGPNPQLEPPEETGEMLAGLQAPQLIMFALSTQDADSVAAAARAAGLAVQGPTPGSRRTPDGETLAWRAVAVSGHEYCEYMPFFIEWAEGSAHPSTTSPGGIALTALHVAHPDAAGLNQLYDRLGVPFDAAEAVTASIEAEFAAPSGAFILSKSGDCVTSLF